jgi:hypothetical protein
VGTSTYHGLQLSVQQQMSHGLHIAGNYTFSHAIDSGSDWRAGFSANGFAAGDAATTDLTLPGLDRGNSTFDIRHRLTFNYVWDLPLFQTSHGWLGKVLGGWQWNGIWSFQSGAHWSPFRGSFGSRGPVFDDHGTGACNPATFDPTRCFNVGDDYNLDGVANDRPNAIASNVNATHAQWADGFNLPEGFFTAPCLGCVGNLGRNTFVGPGYWAVDTSIFKKFRLSDRVLLQFRAEAFNVFNHTNFQLGEADINNLKNPLFGQAGGTFNPRQLQFGLKLSF